MRIEPGKHWKTAMEGYHRELMAIVERYPDANILELGGGRWPSFRLKEMPPNVAIYTVNDIDPNELANAPDEYGTACFDVSGDSSAFADTYDVVFSRFLAEHVPDGFAMHRNVYKVLKPGTGARHPSSRSQVTVHYSGWTTDGKMFDSSVTRGEPATFPLNQVIPGWTEGVGLMVEGEKRRLWIPEALAYKGTPGRPAGMLVFDVELIKILK